MKIWVFYLRDVSFQNFIRVYAYTDKKSYMEDFLSVRKSKLLYCIKRTLSREEWEEFDMKNKHLSLDYRSFYTRDKNNKTKAVPVKILCTMQEEEILMSNIDRLFELYRIELPDIRAYKDEYIKSLEKLLYIKFYNFYNLRYRDQIDSFYTPYYQPYYEDDDFSEKEFRRSYHYDELALFVEFFKNTIEEEPTNADLSLIMQIYRGRDDVI